MRRLPAVVSSFAGLVLAWTGSVWVGAGHPFGLRDWIEAVFGPDVLSSFLNFEGWFVGGAVDPLLFLVSFALPVALLVRLVSRAGVRAGLPDPLDRVRAWTAAHGKLTSAALALPAVAWFAVPTREVVLAIVSGHGINVPHITGILARLGSTFYGCMELFALGMAVTSVGVYAGMRKGLRAFLSPTLDPATPTEALGERVEFDAVAVTAETRLAVVAMAALSVAMVSIESGNLWFSGAQVVFALYVAVALGGVLAFRRASRIAVGVDGVYVTGTSRSRFFAYKDIDSVRARGTDVELLRGERVLLRLQLHGPDATHKDAIVARITEAVLAAKARETAAVGEIVGSASEAELARLAEGASGYRTQSVTREQLWSVVEGPGHGAEARTAAARALAKTGGGDGDERARLRVAAQKSAEPRVRVALAEMAEEEEEAGEGIVGRLARSRG